MVEHQGINKTMKLITQDFTWPELRKTVIEYINTYNTYAKAKYSRHKLYRKLQMPALFK